MEPTLAPWIDQALTSLRQLDDRAAAVLAGAAISPDQAANLYSLRTLLECVFVTVFDPGVLVALDPDPPDANAQFDQLPRGGMDGPQSDAQRSRIYQLATDLTMHQLHLAHWIAKHWPPCDLVEALNYGQSEAAISLLERRSAQVEGGPE